jgi:hypothetical protein
MWVIEATSLPVPQEQVNQMAEHLAKFKNLLVGYSYYIRKYVIIYERGLLIFFLFV